MKAADRKGAAFIQGAANTDVLMYSATTASKSNALPDGFCGQFVRIQPIGTDLYYFFSVEPATATGVGVSTIALPPAATDAGAQAATQGELIKSGAILEVEVPFCKSGATMVTFNRWGVTAGQSVQITKASGKPGDNFNP